MKKVNLFVILFLVIISCSKKDDINQTFEIKGRFKHLIPDCDNGGNFEINCVEFIDFIDNSTVDVLIGGGDIVVRTKYHLNKNRIEFEPVRGLNFDISFNIKSNSTLNRIQDDGIWLKTK